VGGDVSVNVDVGGDVSVSVVVGGDVSVNVDVGGDVSVNVVVGGDVSANVDVGGDVSVNVVVGGDVSVNMVVGGDVSVNVHVGGDVSVNVDVGGDVSVNVDVGGDVSVYVDGVFILDTADNLEFCFLGDMLGKGGGVEEECRTRMLTWFSWGNFYELAPSCIMRGTSLRLKGKIYKACVQSVLVYSSETWVSRFDSWLINIYYSLDDAILLSAH